MTSLHRVAVSALLTAVLVSAPAFAGSGSLQSAGDQPTDLSAQQRQEGRNKGGGGGGRGGPPPRVQQPQRVQQPRVQQQRVQQPRQQQPQRVQQQPRQQQQQPRGQDVQRQQQQQRQDRNRAEQQQRQDRNRAQQQDRQRQQQDRQRAQDQQRQDRQKAQDQRRDRDRAQQQDRQRQQQDRQRTQDQPRDREQRRRQDAQQRDRDRQVNQRDRQQRRVEDRNQRQRLQQDRFRERANRSQAVRFADTQRSRERATRRFDNRVNRDVARNGRFAARYYNTSYARVRYAGWAPDRAWRRGLRAGFVPWGIGLGVGAAVFWPYAYSDIFDYTFWPTGYYGGYWAYAYDDFFDGIWWSEEPAYVTEALAYQPAPAAPPPPGGGLLPPPALPPVAGPGSRPPLPPAGSQPPQRASAETTGTVNCANTGSGLTAWPFDRIQSSLNLSAIQQDQLDSLRDAAARAADAMRDSCPTAAPRSPVERLQAMRDRLEGTLESVKIVRPALESFYDSLSADQRQQFEALGPKITETQDQGRADLGDACRSDKPGLANFPIEKIQEAVSPTDDQLNLLDALEDATFKAVEIMKAACPTDPPASPGQRLAATEARIQAMVEAAKVIQPALDDFYAALNDQQKTQFGRMKG